jgi:iron complex outermembrane receptor protein
MPSQAGLNVRLNTVNFKLVYNNFKLSKLDYSLGINGMLQNNAIQDATDFPIPNYNLSEISSFVYAHWKSNRWNITSGLSFDIRALKTEDLYTNLNSNTGFNQPASQNTMGAVLQQSSFTQNFNGLSASIGSTFRASEFVHFKFNIARGYRAPNIAEIASNGLDPGAHIVYVGNRNFVPETNLQQDVGITIESKSISASLSVFNNYVQHYIHFSQVVDAEGNPIELVQGNKTFQYQQASAQLYGFEGTINVSPKPLRGLSWRNAVSLVYGNNTKKEFENSGTLGQYLPFIPPLKIVSGLHQEVRLKTKQKQLLNFSFEMDYSALSNRNSYISLYFIQPKCRY